MHEDRFDSRAAQMQHIMQAAVRAPPTTSLKLSAKVSRNLFSLMTHCQVPGLMRRLLSCCAYSKLKTEGSVPYVAMLGERSYQGKELLFGQKDKKHQTKRSLVLPLNPTDDGDGDGGTTYVWLILILGLQVFMAVGLCLLLSWISPHRRDDARSSRR